MIVAVDFVGGQAETAELTWGQQAIWAAIGRTAPNDHYFNFSRVLDVPARARPLPVRDVLSALSRVVSRHTALRTRIEVGDHGPRQRIDSAGTLPVELVPADGPDTAHTLAGQLTANRFWYDQEYPLRIGLVVRDEIVEQVVLAFCHLAADGHGADVVVRELRLAILGRTGAPPGSVVELVAQQQSEHGRRRSSAVIAFWARSYRRLPVSMFTTVRAEPRPTRYWVARLASPAADRATRLLAARHRVSTSAILLAATAALVGADNGERSVAILPIVHNRFEAEHRDMVATLSQEGLFLLDHPGTGTFADLLAPAWQASLRAYRSALYDPVVLDEVLARVSRERSEQVHPYCCFNDMRLVERPGPVPTAEAVRAAAGAGTLTFQPPQPKVSCRFCLHVTAQDDALVIQLTADTRYLPPARIAGFLHALDWLLAESTWRAVELAELAVRLDAVPDVGADVAAEPGMRLP